jgi:hypothetical protein
MGLFNKLFGYRWSLYVIRHDKELVYVMHENSVMRMIGYLAGYFEDGHNPVEPWSLYFNFNSNHNLIKLGPEHFQKGELPSNILINRISQIDPGWQVKGAEPVFMEAATKKQLKIMDYPMGRSSDDIAKWMQDTMNNMETGKKEEPTFFSVMNEVFGK